MRYERELRKMAFTLLDTKQDPEAAQRALSSRAAALGVRLTREEAASLARTLGKQEDFHVKRGRFLRHARALAEREDVREHAPRRVVDGDLDEQRVSG